MNFIFYYKINLINYSIKECQNKKYCTTQSTLLFVDYNMSRQLYSRPIYKWISSV